jgi:uncharacterized membrane protein YtjA (UPF0391 family)
MDVSRFTLHLLRLCILHERCAPALRSTLHILQPRTFSRINASGTAVAASWHPGSSTDSGKQPTTEKVMLSWSIIFLVVALIAAFLGFAGIAGTAAWIAKVLFVVFLVLFLVSLIFGRRVR